MTGGADIGISHTSAEPQVAFMDRMPEMVALKPHPCGMDGEINKGDHHDHDDKSVTNMDHSDYEIPVSDKEREYTTPTSSGWPTTGFPDPLASLSTKLEVQELQDSPQHLIIPISVSTLGMLPLEASFLEMDSNKGQSLGGYLNTLSAEAPDCDPQCGDASKTGTDKTTVFGGFHSSESLLGTKGEEESNLKIIGSSKPIMEEFESKCCFSGTKVEDEGATNLSHNEINGVFNSVSSTDSSFSSTIDLAPTSLGHSNSSHRRLPSGCRSATKTPNTMSYTDSNDVFDEQNEEIDTSIVIKHERRRSSKRAMSSSADDYTKLKTRLSLAGFRGASLETDYKLKTTYTEGNPYYKDETNITDQPSNHRMYRVSEFAENNPFESQKSHFALHDHLTSLPHCKLISTEESIYYLLGTYNQILPDVEKLFPWLHGIHKMNYGQISFLSNGSNASNKRRVITFDKPTLSSVFTYDDGESSSTSTPSSSRSSSSSLPGSLKENEEGIKSSYNDVRTHSLLGESSEEYERQKEMLEKEEEEEEAELDDITRLTQTPDARFLIPIRSCNTNGEMSSQFTNVITESTGLIKGSISAEDILISYSNISNLEVYLRGVLPAEVFKVYHPETIITDCILTHLIPVFKDMDPEMGINLRNFHIQVSKISNISDFIVYCLNECDHNFNMKQSEGTFVNNKCKCVNLSRLLHIAQLVYQHQHPELLKKHRKKAKMKKRRKEEKLLNGKKYNTFIISELDVDALKEFKLVAIPILDVESSVKKEDELCSKYDINVFNNWDSNYLYRERLEISKMSTATPLPGDIWLGNITDYECLQIQLNNEKSQPRMNSTEVNYLLKDQKSKPLYCKPENTVVKLTQGDFDAHAGDSEACDRMLITFPRTLWKFYIKCIEGARIPNLSQLKLIYDNYKDCEFINIEFPPSGSITLADMSDEEILSIINICKFCYYICDSDFPSLIYCSDGYTETSLLALCYLMYSENICLDGAILKLHQEYGRPFFIFKTDYVLLSKLETIMNKFSPLTTMKDESRDFFKFEDDAKSLRSLLLLMPKKKNAVGQVGQVGQVGVGGGNKYFGNNHSNQHYSKNGSTSFVTNTGHHTVQLRGGPQRVGNNHDNGNGKPLPFGVNNAKIHNFNNVHTQYRNNYNYRPKMKPNIDGSFAEVSGSLPSRIMNHMYLGSLIHATSIPLLSRLNIEYIVSVGEKIQWAELYKHETMIDESTGVTIYEFSPGQLDEDTGYIFPIKKMIILDNINDDGMGSLIKIISKTLEFIGECYDDNGRVLVHCQVGVSRSATVCIAEVMKRMKLSVARAYMFVRVRRLNVIIQPNLKLMYELFKWEEELLTQKTKSNLNLNSKLTLKLMSKSKSKSSLKGPLRSRSESISSVASSLSTVFTNSGGGGGGGVSGARKSERSSMCTTRGNSLSSWVTGVNACKGIGRIHEEEPVFEDVVETTEGAEDTSEGDDVYDVVKYDVVSNCEYTIREVDWCVLCREIYNLNKAYIK